jgi:siroheme synthase (precorrin-2 oxidase/ferrochelatase)
MVGCAKWTVTGPALDNSDVTAAVLARQIKTRIEETLEPRLGELVALTARLRLSAAKHVVSEPRLGRLVLRILPGTADQQVA